MIFRAHLDYARETGRHPMEFGRLAQFADSITPLAIQHRADPCASSIASGHPGAIHPWRIMPHVLGMSAFQIRNPVAFFVLMKSSNFPICHVSHHRPSAQGFFPQIL